MLSYAAASLLLLLSLSAVHSRSVLKLPSEAANFFQSNGGEEDAVGARWAVLIAGSNGYWNYRHHMRRGEMGSSSMRSKSMRTMGVAVDNTLLPKSLSVSRSMGLSSERTVRRLRLSKALTMPDTTTIYEASCRMAARRVDALLLTDSDALLCGILTDKDIATRVIAQEINLKETCVSKVMTRNPVFVLSDTLAVEALQKMVQLKLGISV